MLYSRESYVRFEKGQEAILYRILFPYFSWNLGVEATKNPLHQNKKKADIYQNQKITFFFTDYVGGINLRKIDLKYL